LIGATTATIIKPDSDAHRRTALLPSFNPSVSRTPAA
jgi:hypothetical protein